MGAGGSAARRPRAARRLLATAALASLLLPATAGVRASQAEPPSKRDFRRDPPRVEALFLQLEGTGQARLFVRFAAQKELPRSIRLDLGGEPVTLSAIEDGDRPTYSALVRLDPSELARRQESLDALRERLGRDLVFPEFGGRVKLRDLPVPRVAVDKLLAGGKIELPATWVAPDEVDASRLLVITDPSVIGDPSRTFDPCTGSGTAMGKWTFGYLMQQIANTGDAAALVRSWLASWESDQTVNGFTVRRRELVQSAILNPWPRTSAAGQPLDLAKAPFRLLAIVNRVDLAENLVYGSGSAGEARLVFGAVGPPPACTPLRFTVIFEYGIERSGCAGLRSWAREWSDLGQQTLGSAPYNAALEAITEQFVRAGSAPDRPNGSALAQLRTNEIALADLAVAGENAWDMREFRLDGGGALVESTVKRAPATPLDRTAAVADFVNPNAAAIVADSYDVPAQFPSGTPFLGGNARVQPDTFWTGPTPSAIASPDARFHFSLNTCGGCHARETGTAFVHVSPLSPSGSAAALSGFLTGVDVADPETGAVRRFADLERRRVKLADLANRSCLFQLFSVPLPMAH